MNDKEEAKRDKESRKEGKEELKRELKREKSSRKSSRNGSKNENAEDWLQSILVIHLQISLRQIAASIFIPIETMIKNRAAKRIGRH